MKLKKPEKLTATFTITTPMFMGGANSSECAESISPSSIKGALRFWWRATNWDRVRLKESDDVSALRQLHSEEGVLFGSATDKSAKQSLAHISIEHIAPKPIKPDIKEGAQYLLGQGLWNYKSKLLRDALPCGEFKLHVYTNQFTSMQREQLVKAITALGCLGGLGSRARKGFGSIAIQEIVYDSVQFDVPRDIPSLGQFISTLSASCEEAPFTAFSKSTRIDYCGFFKNNGLDVVETIGRDMQLYRSFGRDGKVNNSKAEKNFKDDHDDMQDVARGRPPVNMPKRAVFGLPHSYFFSSISAKFMISPNGTKISRRASPLLIHVHQFPGDDDFCGIQTLIPADFLPHQSDLTFKGKQQQRLTYKSKETDWNVIHTYMDRFKERSALL